MLFLIALAIVFTVCVLTTVILVSRIMRGAYEKRFNKNVHRHLDVLPKKKDPPPPPEEPSILSFILLERFYSQQQPQLTLPSYKEKQTAAYVQSLPPTYDEVDLNSPSPPPAYVVTDLEDIPEEDETRSHHG